MAKKTGHPTKYKQEYCQRLIEFFDIEPIGCPSNKFFYRRIR